jgi:hypothetical protein
MAQKHAKTPDGPFCAYRYTQLIMHSLNLRKCLFLQDTDREASKITTTPYLLFIKNFSDINELVCNGMHFAAASLSGCFWPNAAKQKPNHCVVWQL